MKTTLPVLLLILVFAGSAAGSENRTEPLTISGQAATIELRDSPFDLRLSSSAGRPMLTLISGPSFTTVRGQKDLFTQGRAEPWTKATTVVSSSQGSDYIEWEMAASPGGAPLVRMRASLVGDHSARVSCEVLNRPEVNRLALRFASGPDDRYYGMGERYAAAEHQGAIVRNWCEEGGVGLGRLKPILPGVPDPFPHGPDQTYFPVPFFLNPRGYGFLLDDTHFSAFDFGRTDPKILGVTNWNNRLDFIFFYGPSPLETITAATAYTGRVTVPPPWAFGVWNSAVGGSARVRQVAEVTRREKIPASAIWAWDWSGGYGEQFNPLSKFNQELDRRRYPDYEQLAADLHRDGFRWQGYFSPYLGARGRAFRDAAAKGYLVKNPRGQSYVFPWLLFRVGQPDLTIPAARAWWQQSLFAPAEALGQDGWMQDFSEYTPPDAVFANGQDGWAMHNAYPVLWGQAARQFWDQARPDGDYAFYMRAGYTGLQKYASIIWTGDSNMSWELTDGLPSTIPAVTSVGISGFPIASTDIAGYHCVTGPVSDRELFFRWTQLGALLPVMRTHEGTVCPGQWFFDRDPETLTHWKKYAVLHAQLFPYFYTLADEAAAKGWPVVRHLMLHYPNDPGSASEEYEFLVGDRLLVAPVIVDRARSRAVYFPPGEWVDFWSGRRYQGPGRQTVAAPLDTIPLFVKSGTMIPTFDGRIDTLVKEDRPELNGWDDANRSIKLLFFGKGRDRFRLWDGTEIDCDSSTGKCDVTGGPDRIYSHEFK